MRRSAWMLFVLLVLSFGANAEAQLLETWTYFFNCNEALVGWSWEDECLDDDASSGQQSGAYRHVETMNCEGGTGSTGQWYYWNGSDWTAFSGPPGPNC